MQRLFQSTRKSGNGNRGKKIRDVGRSKRFAWSATNTPVRDVSQFRRWEMPVQDLCLNELKNLAAGELELFSGLELTNDAS